MRYQATNRRISGYTAARNLAQQLTQRAIVALLSKSLAEEENTDQLLDQVARSLMSVAKMPAAIEQAAIDRAEQEGLRLSVGRHTSGRPRLPEHWSRYRSLLQMACLNARLAPSIWHIAAHPDSVAPALQIPGSCRPVD